MTTTGQIIERGLRPMRDPDMTFFDPSELIDWVNEAVNDISIRQQLFTFEGTSTSTNGEIDPPASPGEFVQWRYIKDSTGFELAWISEQAFGQMSVDEYADTSSPLCAAYGLKVRILPAPDDGEVYTCGYWGLNAQLADEEDELPTPRTFDDKIVAYVQAQCYAKLDDPDMYERKLAFYNFGLNDPKRSYSPRRPGQVPWGIEPGIFDLDTERMH